MKKTMKKALSFFLSVLMIVTTMSVGFFGITAIAASTSVTKIDNALIAVPETVYMTPSTGASTTGQYYVNNTINGSAVDLEASNNNGSGYVQLSIPGAKSFTVSVSGVTLAGEITEGSTVNFDTNGYVNKKITLNSDAGINAGSTALAEWKFTVTMNDGSTRTYYAYSTLYAPFVSPVGAAAEAQAGSKKVYLGSIFWVDGVHSVSASGYSGATSYYPNATNFVPLTGVINIFNNEDPVAKWLQTGSNGLANSINYLRGNEKNHRRVNVISPIANITVDTSRYSNFNQIPNFKLGYLTTDSEGSSEGSWYIANYTGYDYENGDGDGKDLSNSTDGGSDRDRREDYYNAPHGSQITSGSDKNCELQYYGAWNSGVITGKVMLKAAGYSKGTKTLVTYTCWNNNFVELNVIGANKAALRKLVLEGSTLNEKNYTSSTWSAYKTALQNAALALGNPTNASVDTTALTNARNALQTNVYFDGNDGTPSVTSAGATIGANTSTTYNATATASRTGYTFKGWSTDENATTGSTSVNVGFNNTLYAVWEANTYTVVFDNLFDFTKFKINTGELEVNERTDSGFTVTSTAGSGADANTGFSYAIPVEPGKTYVLSADIAIEMPNGANKGYDIYIHTLDANQTGETTATPDTSNGAHREGDVYISLTGQTENNSNAYIRFTAGENTKYIKFRFDANNADNKLTVKNIRFYEDGTVADGISYVAPITVTYGSTYGTLPTPTKPSHRFTGWYKADGTQLKDTDTVNITDTLYVTSKWQQTGYTVKWVNYDGTVLETDTNVAAGATPKYDGANPVKPATNYYTYEFTGWSPALSSVTGDVTYTAQFKETAITYTITWVIDGKTETATYKYGDTPVHADPVKGGNAQYSYAFTGWEPAIATVTGNATYTAQFKETVITYTITWDIDGVKTTETYKYGDTPVHADPVKAGNAQYSYAFTGWEPAIATVTGNATYTAKFSQTTNKYTIKFVNEDGTTIQSGKVAYGEMPAEPTVVYKAADNYYTYEFAGWDNEIVEVTGDATYTATFTPVERKYTIKWTFADGSVTTDELGYDAVITAPANSEAQAPDAGYHYSYAWSPAVADTVTGNANYKEELVATAHNWTDWAETKTPTCADEGAEERHCTVCNYSETQAKDKLAHTPAAAVEENRVESSCTVAGSYDSVVYCSECGARLSSEKIDLPLAQHTEGQPNVENKVAPDCENGGSYEIAKYCTVCNAQLSRETVNVDKLGHIEGAVQVENEKEVTCTVDGSYDNVTYCTRENCGKELTRETVVIKAPGHKNSEVQVENKVDATCTVDGSYDNVVYCTVCNAELSRETVVIKAEGHKNSEVKIEKEVKETCTVDGSYDKVVYCTVCNVELSRETVVVPAPGHTSGEVVKENVKDATCTENGSYDAVVYCTVCGAQVSRTPTTIEAPGHTPAAAVEENRVESTCTVKGSYDSVIYCSVCKAKISSSKVYLDLAEHTPAVSVEENRVESSCTVKGSYDSVIYCSVCNYEIARTEITLPLAEHTPAAAVEENRVPSTCTVAGSYDEVVYCAKCNAQLSRETKALDLAAHTPGEVKVENNVAPDCVNTGSYDNVVYCTVCNAELSRNKVTVDALGHKAKEAARENYKPATCLYDGSYDMVVRCERCNEILSSESFVEKATGDHVYATETERSEPTCKEDGYVIKACGCGTTKTEVLPATGHKAADAVKENENPATCTADGSYDSVVYCSVCKEELSRKTETVSALGHTSAAAVEENRTESTCTVAGSYDSVVYCSVCKAELSRETKALPLADHTPKAAVEENRKESTCTVAGSYESVVYCDKCNAELSRKTVALELAKHSPAEAVKEKDVPASCMQNGSYQMAVYCSVCSAELSRTNHVNVAPGHKAAEPVVENVNAATCTKKGSYDEVVYCSVCKAELSRETKALPIADHTPKAAVEEHRTESTCKVAGSYQMAVYCSVCNGELSRETFTLPLAAHTPAAAVEENRNEPTCKVPGSYDTVVYCSVCNDVLSRETNEIPVVAHTPAAAVEEGRVESTCKVAGSYDSVVYCSVCGDELSRETIDLPLADHTEGEEVIENNVAPDCVNDGSYETVVYCTVCGDELSRETTVVDALGHTEGEEVIENNFAPDCENDGSYETVVYCTVCKKELSRVKTTVDALGHTAAETVVEKEVAADCKNDGSYDNVVYCSVCGDELSRETVVVPALGHTAADAVVEKEFAADCKNDGSYDSVVYCSVCNEEISRKTVVVPALGHTKGEAVRENEHFVSCRENGTYDEVFYCTVCGEEISREKITVAGGIHTPGTPVIENRVVASCAVPSSYDEVVYCSVCDEEISRKTITGSTIAHKPEKIVKEYVKEATCTRSGSYDEVVYCGVCYTELSRTTVSTGAKGHTIVVDKAVEATCTQTGKTVGSHCAVCNVVIVAQTTVPARGHDIVVDRGYEPTCTRTGLTDGSHCIICDIVAEEQEVIPALGHLDENADGICDIDGRDVTDMDPDYGIEVGPEGDGGNHNTNECSICGREHINFFSEIICLIYKILRIFGYKVK